jgi:hypothetical protein
MRSDAYDDLEQHLAAAFEPVRSDPTNAAALRALAEALERHCGDDERAELTYVRMKLAHDRALNERDQEFIIRTARLALEEYRDGF